MEISMLIPLTNQKYAIIDDEDYDLIKDCKWQCRYDGYAVASKGRRMHRIIMGLSKRDKVWVDHINGDGLDNRKINLRVCNSTQNIANSKMRINNKSGFKGVYWNKERQKWSAQIKFHRKSTYIGHFNNIEEAAHAYDKVAYQLFGEFALTNEKLGNFVWISE